MNRTRYITVAAAAALATLTILPGAASAASGGIAATCDQITFNLIHPIFPNTTITLAAPDTEPAVIVTSTPITRTVPNPPPGTYTAIADPPGDEPWQQPTTWTATVPTTCDDDDTPTTSTTSTTSAPTTTLPTATTVPTTDATTTTSTTTATTTTAPAASTTPVPPATVSTIVTGSTLPATGPGDTTTAISNLAKILTGIGLLCLSAVAIARRKPTDRRLP